MSLFAVFHIRKLEGDHEVTEFVEFFDDLEIARDSASDTLRAKGGRCDIDCDGQTVEVLR